MVVRSRAQRRLFPPQRVTRTGQCAKVRRVRPRFDSLRVPVFVFVHARAGGVVCRGLMITSPRLNRSMRRGSFLFAVAAQVRNVLALAALGWFVLHGQSSSPSVHRLHVEPEVEPDFHGPWVEQVERVEAEEAGRGGESHGSGSAVAAGSTTTTTTTTTTTRGDVDAGSGVHRGSASPPPAPPPPSPPSPSPPLAEPPARVVEPDETAPARERGTPEDGGATAGAAGGLAIDRSDGTNAASVGPDGQERAVVGAVGRGGGEEGGEALEGRMRAEEEEETMTADEQVQKATRSPPRPSPPPYSPPRSNPPHSPATPQPLAEEQRGHTDGLEEMGGAATGSGVATAGAPSATSPPRAKTFELAKGGWSKMPRLKDGSDWRQALDAEEEEEDDEGNVGAEKDAVAASDSGGVGGGVRVEVNAGQSAGGISVNMQGQATGLAVDPQHGATHGKRFISGPSITSLTKTMGRCLLQRDTKPGGLCVMWAQRGQCTATDTAEWMRRDCRSSCCRVGAMLRFKQKQSEARAARAAAALAAERVEGHIETGVADSGVVDAH